MNRRRLPALLVALTVVAACAGGDDDTAAPSAAEGVRIASFDFPESQLLAELYAQAVEETGTPVVRLGAIGPREVVAPALELDRIDVVPEYLGTALQRAGESAPSADATEARADLADRLAPRGLVTLEPSSAENTNVVVVTTAFATSEAVVRISDLAPLAAGLRFGGPPECPERPLCLVGLEAVYGLRFAEFVSQRSQRFTAEALRREEIDVALMFSTDAALLATDLLVLADDRGLQPAENVVPLVRADALDRWGDEIVTALNAVSEELTSFSLRQLNAEVADGVPVGDVARDWRRSHGLAG